MQASISQSTSLGIDLIPLDALECFRQLRHPCLTSVMLCVGSNQHLQADFSTVPLWIHFQQLSCMHHSRKAMLKQNREGLSDMQ